MVIEVCRAILSIISLHLQKEFRELEAERQHPVSSCVVKQSILGLNLIQPLAIALPLQLSGQLCDQVLSRATSVGGSLPPGASASCLWEP